MLYDAITGSSSRLVISSMSPELPTAQGMGFEEYLRRMGEKFIPAAESSQMEAEYRSRRQGKNKDVQNYINAKHELFQLAFPNPGEGPHGVLLGDHRRICQQICTGPDVRLSNHC